MSRRALVMLLFAASPLAAQARPAGTPAARPGAPAPAPAPASAPATAAPRAGQRAPGVDSTIPAIQYNREVYHYQGAPRDPFTSLLTEAAASTTMSDLRLVSIAYFPRGGSIAVVRDRNAASPHRLRVGMTLGRLRVIQIRPYEVVFQIEEFGFERQEVLTLQRPEVNR